MALIATAQPSAPGAARGACPDQGTPNRQLSQGEARAAVRCLINRERSGRRNVALHRKLNGPARRHSIAMARSHCLLHACPGEPASLQRRLRKYLRGASRYRFSEAIAVNLASSTPTDIVRQWMGSPPHRKILLGPFEHVGIGVAVADNFAWFTADFGFRRG